MAIRWLLESERFADFKPGDVTIRGRFVEDALDADVVNNSKACEFHWHLTRERQSQ
jgi:hypothetical protein